MWGFHLIVRVLFCGICIHRAASVLDVILWENRHGAERWPSVSYGGKLPKEMIHVSPDSGEQSLQEK